MDELIRRSAILESLGDRPENWMDSDEEIQACADWDAFHGIVTRLPAVDAVEVVRCRECVHAPVVDGQYKDGFDIEFPDEICPCQCEDGWYNHIPDPDWFCADGKRKDGADNGES